MNPSSILVVDDESGIRSTIHEILSDEGYAVKTAADAHEASEFYKSDKPDLVLLDIWMPDMDGITLLKSWSDQGSLKCPIVVMSGHGTVDTAVEATRLGAVDYIEKPLSLAQLLRTVETALRSPVALSPGSGLLPVTQLETPQGKSRLIEAAREQAREIARHDVPTLITGEAGAGRDLFGRYIHDLGTRAGKSFVIVNGVSLTDDNAVEQLVGTNSSHGDEPGLLQQAAGGTLFISELQGMGSKAQSFLLGVIEQGTYVRPGHAQRENTDMRLMASVLANSGEELRADLLAAFGVMQLSVPPLREYSEDIPGLLHFYVGRSVDAESLPYRRFDVAAQNRLRNYPWPGNLRELKALVRKLLLAGTDEEVDLAELESCLTSSVSDTEPLVKQDLLALPMREAREQFERAYLQQQLVLCDGKVGKLAERVSMERTHLYRKLRSLNIDFKRSTTEH
ncbi:MAG: sigma-54 dependent transcriptional regulator [Gammaproteobacteria bacterium]|jgi:DNA-binding NtrC family response regulator|nr:sigma-54 dependent transcriptional regulator [Gammaproteobacteria bacterium]MDP6617537.1 sigma-54 dependent transcriptional regulator [Gammaproteobacteria bacterium]MDP6694414.1 sigma-54 dependent transcriptional regulator [Gammaproteobacteria bacterium]MDP7041163.1 sigma-54 dependent transcriptional regulator [Gammaproteobacteria bacterium]